MVKNFKVVNNHLHPCCFPYGVIDIRHAFGENETKGYMLVAVCTNLEQATIICDTMNASNPSFDLCLTQPNGAIN